MPYYICDSALLPIQERNIEIDFYGTTTALLPTALNPLRPNEILVLVDFFGVVGRRITPVMEGQLDRVVFDDTHAFYKGRRMNVWSFNSARKFHGVPDGGYLFAPLALSAPTGSNEHISSDHLLMKRLGADNDAYLKYQQNELRMKTDFLKGSRLTELLLARQDHSEHILRRRTNFNWLHEQLGGMNQLDLQVDETVVPLCYPLLPSGGAVVERQKLYRRGLFLPTYWNDVVQRADDRGLFSFEKDLSRRLLALPIDQRYTEQDMAQMLDRLLPLIH